MIISQNIDSQMHGTEIRIDTDVIDAVEACFYGSGIGNVLDACLVVDKTGIERRGAKRKYSYVTAAGH
jgi:hypothetical protein